MVLPSRQTLRFIVVGVTVAALQFLLSYAFMRLGLRPAWAAVLAYGVAFICAYTAHKYWTFASEASHQRLLPRYFAAQLCAALLGGLVAEACAHWLHAPDLLTAALSTVSASVLAYLLSSRWVFAV